MKKGNQRMTRKPNRQSALCNVVGISQVFKTGNCVTNLFPANSPAITGPSSTTKSSMCCLNDIIVNKDSNYASAVPESTFVFIFTCKVVSQLRFFFVN